MLYRFIKQIARQKLLTPFIKNVFDYEKIYDYNYLFRIIKDNDSIIIDIYDNISSHRFNRYIFDFGSKIKDGNSLNHNNVFLTYININYVKDSTSKLYKLAYLFKLDNDKMLEYADDFLDNQEVKILEKLIKK